MSDPPTAPAVRSPLAVVTASDSTSSTPVSPEAVVAETTPSVPLASRSALWVVWSRSEPSGQRIATVISGARPNPIERRPSRFGARTATSCRPVRSETVTAVPAAARTERSSSRAGASTTSTRGSFHVSTVSEPAGISTRSAT